MADPIDPRVIAAILLEKEGRLGSDPYGLPQMPPMPIPTESTGERAAMNMGLPAGAAPAIDALLGVEPTLREFTGVPQINRAGDAIVGAINDPSLANVTNAGVQGALGVARPMAAMKILGGGLGAAAVKDSGILDFDAQAQQRLNRQQRQDMEMERQRAERDAAIRQREAEADAVRKRLDAEVTQKRELEAETTRKEREIYDRAVKKAEGAYDDWMAEDRRFSKTSVGKVWDKTGGLAPAIFGLAGAKLSRLATGPGKTPTGEIVKDYVLPLTSGTISGAVSSNAPLYYNSQQTEPDNPKRRAYEAYVENAPKSDPRRQEYEEALKDFVRLPKDNPLREAAAKEYYDKMGERLFMGGMEGFGGGIFGTDIVRAIGRALKGRGPESGPPTGGPAGALVDDTLSAGASSRAPIAGEVLAPGTQLASSAAGRALAEGPQPLPAGAASSRPTYNGVPLPPGVELNSRGIPYDIRTGHPIRQRIFKAKEE